MTGAFVNAARPGPGGERPAARGAVRRETVFAVRRTAPSRRRLPWRRWVVAAALLVLLGAGGWWLTQSGVFAVTRLGTGAYRFTEERSLKAALSPLLGRNLWSLTPQHVRDALAPLPWVREVYVRRRLPGAVDIELIEWRPVLVVAEPGAPAGAPALVLVEDGRVLPFPPRLPVPELPVLTGVLVERSAGGPAHLPATVMAPVLELVAAMESSGLEAVAPVDFVVAGPDGFGIVLQRDETAPQEEREAETTLLVGREEFAERLERYLTAREHVAAGVEVDLRFKGRLTVRQRAVPEAPDEEQQGTDARPQEADGNQHQRRGGTRHRPAAKEDA